MRLPTRLPGSMLGNKKPLQRSRLRLWVGRQYLIGKRKWQWHRQKETYAVHRDATLLPTEIKRHRSLLLRQLRDVDMYLQHNKVINLERAISNIDGLIVAPGEVFSFWFLVGAPTRKRGYVDGLVLNQGKIGVGVGGGLCQLGNLLYWMILHSPLSVVERWRHSFDVFPDQNRRLPFGSGATLAYNYIDLQIKNDTAQSFQICLGLSERFLHGTLRAEHPLSVRYEIVETDHQMIGESWGGYTRHNRICKQTYDKVSGELFATELVTENHAIMMYTPLLSPGGDEP